jgi:hypothetical protein
MFPTTEQQAAKGKLKLDVPSATTRASRESQSTSTPRESEPASQRKSRSKSPPWRRRATCVQEFVEDKEPISFWRTTSHGVLNTETPVLEHDAEIHPAPLGGEEFLQDKGQLTKEEMGGPCPVDFHEHGFVRDELTGALHIITHKTP